MEVRWTRPVRARRLCTAIWVSAVLAGCAGARPMSRSRPDWCAEDATVLAIQLEQYSDPAASESRIVPRPSLVDSIASALVEVCNLRHPARDSVVEIFALRAVLTWDPRKFFIDVDTTAPWIENWRAGRVPTGQPVIDSLLVPITAAIEQDPSLGAGLFRLRFRQDVNTMVLADRLSAVSLIRNALADIVLWSGSRVIVDRMDGGWRLTWSLRGDICDIECGGHSWTFEVTPGGARFVGSRGDSIRAAPRAQRR